MTFHDSNVGAGSVTVSVVSHQQASLVVQLLADLNLHCGDSIAKLVLTCNLPEPLALDLRNYRFPIETIVNKAPLGFGANHNQAFQRCASEWFLVINPDVRLTSDVIGALLLKATTTTGLLAPQEVDENGHPVQNLRGLITPWEILQRQLLKRERQPPKQGGWVKGMFMLIRSRAYRELNGFDERYFMYCEDFDLCARLILGGWGVVHTDALSVTHAWQRQSHGSANHLKQHLRSLMLMWTSKTYWRYKTIAAQAAGRVT